MQMQHDLTHDDYFALKRAAEGTEDGAIEKVC